MFARLFTCCNSVADGNEVKVVQLSCDDIEGRPPASVHKMHFLAHADIWGSEEQSADATPRRAAAGSPRLWPSPITPRERDFQDRIRLPRMRRYPIPPGCSTDDPDERIKQELLVTYREFVLELHKGIYMTQLTSSQEYSDIHCQVLEDMQTLKVDQGSGCIIEFPLTAVSKVYRIIKNEDRWYNAGSLTSTAHSEWYGSELGSGSKGMPPVLSNAEHIVVVEFMRRKLAFVFGDMAAAQRFLMGIELLIRLAQESRGGGAPLTLQSPGPKAAASNIAPIFSEYSPKSPDDRFMHRLPLHGQPLPEDDVKMCACRPEVSI